MGERSLILSVAQRVCRGMLIWSEIVEASEVNHVVIRIKIDNSKNRRCFSEI